MMRLLWVHKPFSWCLMTALLELAVVVLAATAIGKLLLRRRR